MKTKLGQELIAALKEANQNYDQQLKVLTPYDVQRIKDAATDLYKQKQFTSFEAELQVTICVIVALSAYLGLNIKLQERQSYQSVDDL